jgi:hypothetical protein
MDDEPKKLTQPSEYLGRNTEVLKERPVWRE